MRTLTRLDRGWRFLAGDHPELQPHRGQRSPAEMPWRIHGHAFDDSAWRVIDLPHDFVAEQPVLPSSAEAAGLTLRAEDAMDDALFVSRGSKPYGVAWYRLRFRVNADPDTERVFLRFGGVMADSRLWVNGLPMHREQSGTSTFTVDITEALFDGAAEQTLAVRCDADHAEGWWYEGGGIYREVELITVPRRHLALDGIQILAEPDSETSAGAAITVRAELVGGRAGDLVRVSLFDPDGESLVVASASAGQADGIWTASCRLEQARRWSLDHPALYTARVELLDGTGAVIDAAEERFGIRTAVFDPADGFRLNGVPTKLKGVCCHQDHAGLGIAVPRDLIAFRLRRLKELGANAYRSAHHPASRDLLELCDEMGILVLEEHRLIAPGAEELDQFTRMLRRERNHPAIIAWCIGNEPGFIQFDSRMIRIVERYKALAAELDPTRPLTCAWHTMDRRHEYGDKQKRRHVKDVAELLPMLRSLPLMGFNYSPELWDGIRAACPDRPFVCTEASSSLRTRGAWPTDPEACTVYGEDTHEEVRVWGPLQWRAANAPGVAGSFIWTGFDYRGEPTPYRRWPAVASQFGLLDSCGFLKDNGRYFMSQWRDEPQVHLTPHWNLPVVPGTPVEVHVYSNCERVELFLNGRSLGEKPVDPGHAVDFIGIPYQPGRLRAVGYRGDEEVAEDTVETAGEAAALRCWCMNPEVNRRPGATLVIGIAVVDEQGRTVPAACLPVDLDLTGCRLLGTGNGCPTDHDPEQVPHRRTFNGLMQVIVRVEDPDHITLTANSPGLRAASCN